MSSFPTQTSQLRVPLQLETLPLQLETLPDVAWDVIVDTLARSDRKALVALARSSPGLFAPAISKLIRTADAQWLRMYTHPKTHRVWVHAHPWQIGRLGSIQLASGRAPSVYLVIASATRENQPNAADGATVLGPIAPRWLGSFQFDSRTIELAAVVLPVVSSVHWVIPRNTTTASAMFDVVDQHGGLPPTVKHLSLDIDCDLVDDANGATLLARLAQLVAASEAQKIRIFIDGTPEDDEGRIISAVENLFVAYLPRNLVALELADLYDYLPPDHSAVELPNVAVTWPPTLRSLVFDVGTDDGWMGTFTSRFFDSLLPPLTELCVDDLDLFMMVDRARIVTALLPTLTSFSLTIARTGEPTATFVGLDVLIRELATRCPLLGKLLINTFHAPMTGDELVLCARDTIPHLRALPIVDLELKGWFDKGPETAAPVLFAVAAAMPNLQSLNLLCSYSKPIAADIVHDLVRSLKHLKRIGVKADSGHEALAEVLRGINSRMVVHF